MLLYHSDCHCAQVMHKDDAAFYTHWTGFQATFTSQDLQGHKQTLKTLSPGVTFSACLLYKQNMNINMLLLKCVCHLNVQMYLGADPKSPTTARSKLRTTVSGHTTCTFLQYTNAKFQECICMELCSIVLAMLIFCCLCPWYWWKDRHKVDRRMVLTSRFTHMLSPTTKPEK